MNLVFSFRLFVPVNVVVLLHGKDRELLFVRYSHGFVWLFWLGSKTSLWLSAAPRRDILNEDEIILARWSSHVNAKRNFLSS